MECNDEDRIALDENARKTLEELRTDCPFCVEKVKEFMGISSTTIMSMPDPNAAINYIFNSYNRWIFCSWFIKWFQSNNREKKRLIDD